MRSCVQSYYFSRYWRNIKLSVSGSWPDSNPITGFQYLHVHESLSTNDRKSVYTEISVALNRKQFQSIRKIVRRRTCWLRASESERTIREYARGGRVTPQAYSQSPHVCAQHRTAVIIVILHVYPYVSYAHLSIIAQTVVLQYIIIAFTD